MGSVATIDSREPSTLGRLSDEKLRAELSRLARCERDATCELVAHLAEFDARGLHLGAGFPSLFAYCLEILRLSEHATYNRIEAARAVRRFPVVLVCLRDASINLTTVRLLSPHLTSENHATLLDAASGKSKREVEELIAHWFPQPAAPSSLRKLPVVKSAPAREPNDTTRADEPIAERPTETSIAPALEAAAEALAGSARASRPKAAVTPLAPDRYKVTFTATAGTREKLERARDLLRHQVPDGDLAEIFDRALSMLVAQLEKRKSAASERPRRGTPHEAGAPHEAGSRHIPAEVRRAVWGRDGGSCAFRAKDGRRCGARGFLEFHHVQPFAALGAASVSNIALRCRSHNGYEALLYYGPMRAGP
jgi:hypothetical protein